ncbi:sce7726 family protein [Psychrobacter sp. Ps4]|uniref:sce7726 family protein n=1 Tax=Psychrobacter sp. Ps4 TaxID=2790958 RepID=UPI001EDF6673|nr:sce7726 family protein [Psychrobacter sp. Ps4]MCG3810369.1 sce7726 family protein [Psychrobacter sp. Ps4]
MATDINQLRDFSTFFTRSEILRLLKSDFGSVNTKLQRYNLIEKKRGYTYLKVLKEAYKTIQNNYQNEYVLKNEFLNKCLVEKVVNRDSIIFNELRLGNSIADLAIFNGVSKAFEIKTILDKECRLSGQIKTYKKIFNEVYIIVPEQQVDKYIKFDNEVAIFSYDSSFNKFELVREATRNEVIDIDILMNVLHSKEYLNIIHNHFDVIPELNAFNQFDICKKLIATISYPELNDIFLDTMKARKIHNSFFNKTNNEFNQVSLSLNLKEVERKSLIDKLKNNKVL